MTLRDQFATKSLEVQAKIDFLKNKNDDAGLSFFSGMIGTSISASSLLLLVFLGCKNRCFNEATKDEHAAVIALIGMSALAVIVSIVDLVDSFALSSLTKFCDYGDLSKSLLFAQHKYNILEQTNVSCARGFDDVELTKFNSAETIVFTQAFNFLSMELLCGGEINITALALWQDSV